MKRHFFFLLVFFAAVAFNNAFSGDLTRYVNPFIGTGAVNGSLSGNNYPGATCPFGLVQLSPDTSEEPDWNDACGYDYNKNIIYGFSHTHLSGTGAADFIDISLMPTSYNCTAALFSHSDESAHPGYYQVRLKDENINVELTATTHVGIHRYTFPVGNEEKVILDLNHSAKKGSWGRQIINAQIRIVDDHTVEGYRVITGWAKLRKICFRLEFSKPFVSYSVNDGDRKEINTSVINGNNLHGTFDFGKADAQPLICKVAISPVSVSNAKDNMQAEAGQWNFDEYKSLADNAWEKLLERVSVKGDETKKEIFYTSLYHALIQPNTFSDVNGEYVTADYTVKKLDKGKTQYSTFSLWDTFRAAHPLYTLLVPERVPELVNSLIRQYQSYGYLPIWQLWNQENYCMIGNHSIPVIVEAVMKGFKGIDVDDAYDAVTKSSTLSHPNSPFEVWEKYGYMPEDKQTQSVSITLEQSFDDWCVSSLAKKLGNTDDAARFTKRSQYFKDLYNSATHFFQPKNSNGDWIEPFDPYKYGANGGYPFTEGNAWQYYWYVPHDIASLINLTGGKKAFCKKLDQFFTDTTSSGQRNDNASGLIGQYAHGNEPSHHVAYLYALAGQPWKTQKMVNKIMTTLYNTSSSGYAGNDDCGEMSAWYIFSAMGFYPVNPASGEYVIGTPAFDDCVLSLPNNKTFTIKAVRKSPEDIFVKSVTLNGKPLDKAFITHKQITEGGTLIFTMKAKP